VTGGVQLSKNLHHKEGRCRENEVALTAPHLPACGEPWWPFSNVSQLTLLSATASPKRATFGKRDMSAQLALRVALVTGANKGIGYEIAAQLAEQPRILVLVSARSEEKAKNAVEAMHRTPNIEPQRVEPFLLDIDDEKSIISAAQRVKEKFGGLDILVNNAAIAFKGDAFDENVARTTAKTNYFGTYNMLKHFLPIMRENGRVVNVSSQAGTISLHRCAERIRNQFLKEDLTVPELEGLLEKFAQDVATLRWKENGWPGSCYGISKAAVNSLTRILARDNKTRGLLINACCPGSVRTDMSSHRGNRTPAEGAKTPVYLALLPEDCAITGKFWKDQKVLPWVSETFGV